MARIEERKLFDQKPVFFDKEKERHYSRVFGGFAFPSAAPGFCVIIGEEIQLKGLANLFWLAEIEEQDLSSLIRKSLEIIPEYLVSGFYGSYANETNMRYLQLFNRDQVDKRLPAFDLHEAPYSEDGKIGYHLNIVKDRLNPNSKTLYFEKSKLRNYLMQTDQAVDATEDKFPAIAALGYVVAIFTLQPYRNIVEKPRVKNTNPMKRMRGKE